MQLVGNPCSSTVRDNKKTVILSAESLINKSWCGDQHTSGKLRLFVFALGQ